MRRRLILEGWNEYRRMIPAAAPPVQIEETRRAFYAGAQTLLTSLVMILDPGTEATPDDLLRMKGISDELEQFFADLVRNKKPPAEG
jgi:hypothetical protein